MNINNSFRIKESPNGNFATIWPISDDMFSVKWDNWVYSLTFTKEEIDNCFNCNIWTKLPEQEENLPRTFKFKCKGWPYEYEYTQDKGYRYLNNGVYDEYYPYHQDKVIENIKNGDWIVLPNNPKTTLHISSGIPDGIDVESYTKLNWDIVRTSADNLLDTIKEFTKQGNDVVISAGAFNVYPIGADNPYICPDEESLLEVMGAIETLDSYGG